MVAAALGAVLIAITGCGGAGTMRQDAAMTASAAGGLTARLTMSPHPASVMKPLRLEVALSDGSGRPVAGRTVTFDLSMPSMTMAPDRPSVRESGKGVYTATTLLPMSGKWRLTVEVDAPERRVTFPFTFRAD